MLHSIRRAALGAALAGATLAAMPALAGAALPQTCLKGGVCFSKSFSGASTTLTVTGTAGDDVLAAAFRSDVLIGGPGADVLDGGAGNDQLLAADGETDTLHGGLGADTPQRDAIDTVDGVEAADRAGQLQLVPGAGELRVAR